MKLILLLFVVVVVVVIIIIIILLLLLLLLLLNRNNPSKPYNCAQIIGIRMEYLKLYYWMQINDYRQIKNTVF